MESKGPSFYLQVHLNLSFSFHVFGMSMCGSFWSVSFTCAYSCGDSVHSLSCLLSPLQAQDPFLVCWTCGEGAEGWWSIVQLCWHPMVMLLWRWGISPLVNCIQRMYSLPTLRFVLSVNSVAEGFKLDV